MDAVNKIVRYIHVATVHISTVSATSINRFLRHMAKSTSRTTAHTGIA